MKGFQKFSLAVLCASAIAHAQAATFDISLNGEVSNGVFSSFETGGLHYDYWQLELSSLGLPFNVSVGDTVNASITLNQSVTMPASVTYSYFDLTFTGAFSPSVTETSGTTTFFDNNVQGWSGSQGTSTSSQLSHGFIIFPPDNGAVSFDMVTSNFQISQLETPVELDGASIYFIRVTPVPEPETYAMLLAGLGMVGAAARRRKT